MTRVLTLRIPPLLLSKAEAKASRLGIDRAKYVRSLIEHDVEKEDKKTKHKFASEDLIGSVPLGTGPYTNQRVRAQMRANLLAKREKNC